MDSQGSTATQIANSINLYQLSLAKIKYVRLTTVSVFNQGRKEKKKEKKKKLFIYLLI